MAVAEQNQVCRLHSPCGFKSGTSSKMAVEQYGGVPLQRHRERGGKPIADLGGVIVAVHGVERSKRGQLAGQFSLGEVPEMDDKVCCGQSVEEQSRQLPGSPRHVGICQNDGAGGHPSWKTLTTAMALVIPWRTAEAYTLRVY